MGGVATVAVIGGDASLRRSEYRRSEKLEASDIESVATQGCAASLCLFADVTQPL